jgi:acetyl-CoA carboxylase carboxyltransferase component
VAGGAYLPIMSDEAMIVDKTGEYFLSRKLFSQAAIGETSTTKPGGATTLRNFRIVD